MAAESPVSSTPSPTLADTFDEAIRVCSVARNGNDSYNVTGPHDVIDLTLGDLRAAAARLRKLDRIEAAYEAVRTEHVPMVRPFRPDCDNDHCDLLLRRLTDALEAPDA